MTASSFYFHPAALEEAVAAARWYRERSPRAARRFLSELKVVIARIRDEPRRWPRGIQGTRRLNLFFFPYAVIYWESDGVIRILAVAHGHRRPGYWKDRS